MLLVMKYLNKYREHINKMLVPSGPYRASEASEPWHAICALDWHESREGVCNS